MGGKAAKYLGLGQLSLFGFLGVCYLLNPIFLKREGGVSNYGIHWLTVAPYTLGFGLCGLFTALAAHSISGNSRQLTTLTRALNSLALLFIIVLVTTYPYNLNGFFDWFHKGAGIVLFLFGVCLGFWLALIVSRDWTSILLLIIQASASLVALLTLLGAFHLLFVSQLMAGLAFAVLLVRAVAQLTAKNVVT